MPKRDSDLFERLRQLGVRKQVAKALSELGGGAGKKATRAARDAVTELRAVADEIEKRLPGVASEPPTGDTASAPSVPATRRPVRRAARPTAARVAGGAGGRSTPAGKSAPQRRSASRSTSATSRTPRGENKVRILAALEAGPRTASEIAAETGIGTGTVSSTLTKMTKAGEVTKATRGYALPK